MKRYSLTLLLLALTIIAGSGCGILHRAAYCPLGPLAGPGEVGWGSACGPCGEVACGDTCGEMACEPDCCDGCDACGPYRPFAFLGFIGRLFRPVCWCGPACGERYWGDFYSDPPDCWDPCDRYGNFTGGCGCGAPTCGAVESCGCGEVAPGGCTDCVGRRPAGKANPSVVARQNTGMAPGSAPSPVLPAPKLISVTDEKVEGGDESDEPTVAKRPTRAPR